MKSSKKIRLFILTLLLAGQSLNAQSTWLLKIPQLSTDTLLVLDKVAATRNANFINKCNQTDARLTASLERESRYQQLWKATESKAQSQDLIIKKQQDQIDLLWHRSDLHEKEKQDIRDICKKRILNGAIGGFLIGCTFTAAAILIISAQ